jgi:adenylate cyclase
MSESSPNEALWRSILVDDQSPLKRYRRIFSLMPAASRCKVCNSPFSGLSGAVTRLFWRRSPSNMNPRLCNTCENFVRDYPGGAEIELSLLFADVRGSSALAQSMSPMQFSQIMNRFYTVTTHIMAKSDALIEKFVGDEVCGIYTPSFAGTNHARVAIEAAQEILKATGHGEPGGSWLPVGVGVHTGVAFVGSVGAAGVVQISVLGETANIAARLASQAGAGEIYVSDQAYEASGLDFGALECCQVELKGHSNTLGVHILNSTAEAISHKIAES